VPLPDLALDRFLQIAFAVVHVQRVVAQKLLGRSEDAGQARECREMRRRGRAVRIVHTKHCAHNATVLFRHFRGVEPHDATEIGTQRRNFLGINQVAHGQVTAVSIFGNLLISQSHGSLFAVSLRGHPAKVIPGARLPRDGLSRNDPFVVAWFAAIPARLRRV